ncbi:hypothetical protein ABK040_000600 [Willaertia magna]
MISDEEEIPESDESIGEVDEDDDNESVINHNAGNKKKKRKRKSFERITETEFIDVEINEDDIPFEQYRLYEILHLPLRMSAIGQRKTTMPYEDFTCFPLNCDIQDNSITTTINLEETLKFNHSYIPTIFQLKNEIRTNYLKIPQSIFAGPLFSELYLNKYDTNDPNVLLSEIEICYDDIHFSKEYDSEFTKYTKPYRIFPPIHWINPQRNNVQEKDCFYLLTQENDTKYLSTIKIVKSVNYEFQTLEKEDFLFRGLASSDIKNIFYLNYNLFVLNGNNLHIYLMREKGVIKPHQEIKEIVENNNDNTTCFLYISLFDTIFIGTREGNIYILIRNINDKFEKKEVLETKSTITKMVELNQTLIIIQGGVCKVYALSKILETFNLDIIRDLNEDEPNNNNYSQSVVDIAITKCEGINSNNSYYYVATLTSRGLIRIWRFTFSFGNDSNPNIEYLWTYYIYNPERVYEFSCFCFINLKTMKSNHKEYYILVCTKQGDLQLFKPTLLDEDIKQILKIVKI